MNYDVSYDEKNSEKDDNEFQNTHIIDHFKPNLMRTISLMRNPKNVTALTAINQLNTYYQQ